MYRTITVDQDEPTTLIGKLALRKAELADVEAAYFAATDTGGKWTAQMQFLRDRWELTQRRVKWARERLEDAQWKLRATTSAEKRLNLLTKVYGAQEAAKRQYGPGTLAFIVTTRGELVPAKVLSVTTHHVVVKTTADRPAYPRDTQVATDCNKVFPRAQISGATSKKPILDPGYAWVA